MCHWPLLCRRCRSAASPTRCTAAGRRAVLPIVEYTTGGISGMGGRVGKVVPSMRCAAVSRASPEGGGREIEAAWFTCNKDRGVRVEGLVVGVEERGLEVVLRVHV